MLRQELICSHIFLIFYTIYYFFKHISHFISINNAIYNLLFMAQSYLTHFNNPFFPLPIIKPFAVFPTAESRHEKI